MLLSKNLKIKTIKWIPHVKLIMQDDLNQKKIGIRNTYTKIPVKVNILIRDGRISDDYSYFVLFLYFLSSSIFHIF